MVASASQKATSTFDAGLHHAAPAAIRLQMLIQSQLLILSRLIFRMMADPANCDALLRVLL